MSDPSSQPLQLVIVDEQVMFRATLAHFLQNKLKLKVVASCGTLAQFFGELPKLKQVDIVVTDIVLPDGDGIALASRAMTELPSAKILILSGARQEFLVNKALKAGTAAYVHKDDSSDSLLSAIQAITHGGCYFGQTVQRIRRQMMLDNTNFSKVISEKEQEVLQLLGRGMSNEDAAPHLGVSPDTIQTHRRNVMKKLNLHSAQQLTAYALKHGFITIGDLL
jgi:DNA-binding NarL/FixJ family response regulator